MKLFVCVGFFGALAASSVASATELRGATDLRALVGTCTNTAPHDGLDVGCTSSLPMCFLNSGFEPSADVGGDYCGKCINVFPGNYKDLGCTDANPRCILTGGDEPLIGKGGMACGPLIADGIPCRNSQPFGGKDEGCTTARPICTNPKTNQEASSWAPGVCARCVNSFTSGFADYGCPNDRPRCSLDDGTEPKLLFAGTKCCPAEGCTKCPCTGISPAWDAFVGGTLNPPFQPGVNGDWCDRSPANREDSIRALWRGGGLIYVTSGVTDDCKLGFCWDLGNNRILYPLTAAEGRDCITVLRNAMTDQYGVNVNAQCPAINYWTGCT